MGQGKWVLAAAMFVIPFPVRAQDARVEEAGKPGAAFERLLAAYKGSRWEEVSREAKAVHEGSGDPVARCYVAWMAADAERRLESWEKCRDWCRVFPADYLRVRGPTVELQNLRETASLLRAEALLGSGEADGAREMLEQAGASFPRLKSHGVFRSLLAGTRGNGALLVDRAYEGKYGDDPRLPAALDRVEKALPLALQRIQDRLGLPSLPLPPVVVHVADWEGSDAPGFGYARTFSRGEGRVGVVALPSEGLVTRMLDEALVLAHELTHLLHRSDPKGEAAPFWLGEGLAHWVECGDEAVHRQMVLTAAVSWAGEDGEDPEAEPPLRTIFEDAGKVGSLSEERQRAFGAVLLFHIERTRGVEATRKLVLRLLREEDWESALRQATGKSFPDLLVQVRAEYLEWTGTVFAGSEVVSGAGRLHKAGKVPEALASLEAFLKERPATPLRAWAEFQRANLLAAARDHAGALAAHRALRAAHPSHQVVIPSIRREIEFLRDSGKWEEVLALGPGYVRDYLFREDEARKEAEGAIEEARARLAAGAPPPEGK